MSGVCQTPLPALTTAPYFNALDAISQQEPLIIENPVVIVVNPVAGGGRAASFASKLNSEIYEMTSSGRLKIFGDVIFIKTVADASKRVDRIVRAMKKLDPSRPPIVIAVGGDGNAATVMEALLKLNKKSGYYLVPGPGGMANDLRKNQGFSDKPPKFIGEVARAVPAELDLVSVRINDGPPKVLLQSQSAGASGILFAAVERRLSQLKRIGIMNRVSKLASYLIEAPQAAVNARSFQVRAFLDGASVLIGASEIGEVAVTANTSSLGGVFQVPQPENGARVHFVPISAKLPGPAKLTPCVVPLVDVTARSLRFHLGDQSVIAPGGKITMLSDFVDVPPGSNLRLEFLDLKGEPLALQGALNGDHLKEGIRTIQIETSMEKVQTLAVEGSALLVQRGLAMPKTLLNAFMGIVNKGVEAVNKYGTIAAIAGYEVFKDSGKFTKDERSALDLGLASFIFGSDMYMVAKYGTQLIIGELPIMLPFYEIGYRAVSAAGDYISKMSDIKELAAGETGNKVAAIGGGFAATYGAIKAVGPALWKASAARINSLIIEGAITVSENAGNFFSAAFQFLRNITLTPIFVLPGTMEYLERQGNDNYI